MAGSDLLFELGTEEIPAGLLARALVDLEALARERLAALRLPHGELATLGTPRRLALHVAGLAERQADVSETVSGPSAKAAFDAAGKPTRAALGFAEKSGVPVESLVVVEIPGKGAYVTARREQKGGETRSLLPRLLTELARAIPWKKSMRWAALDESFVRPVHWIVALFGGEVVALEAFGVASGRETRGHRTLAPAPIALSGSREEYVGKLREAFVLVDPATRRTAVEAELARVEKESGVRIRPDDELLAEVANLVEYPRAVAGEFAERFLEIPAEIIVSAMRAHQRYFATEKAGGGLDRRFVTVAGTLVKDEAVVRHGNERVLAARLADARFFFDEDKGRRLDEMAGKLDGVVFQAKLGTIGEKARRLAAFAAVFAPLGVAAAAFARAAALCKADLVSKVVGEFPDLQGMMGREYARRGGEPADVAEAIFEHYLPRGAADRLPAGGLGAALGLADRFDTMVGCFAVGLAPTGSADAFGLRRAALGAENVLLERDWRVDLGVLVDRAAAGLVEQGKIKATAELRAQVLDFLRGRLRGLLVDGKGLPADCVDAALAAGFTDVPDARARAEAMSALRQRPDFEPLAAAFKRVANILKDRGGEADGEPDPARFAHDSERALHAAFVAARERVTKMIGVGDYAGALGELAGLKMAVDRFFDDVLVMDKDPDVRHNRLALLGTINRVFQRIADFRQLAVK